MHMLPLPQMWFCVRINSLTTLSGMQFGQKSMITSLTSDKNQTTRSAISSFIILILKSKGGNISLFKKTKNKEELILSIYVWFTGACTTEYHTIFYHSYFMSQVYIMDYYWSFGKVFPVVFLPVGC